jgi:hypothetical protein
MVSKQTEEEKDHDFTRYARMIVEHDKKICTIFDEIKVSKEDRAELFNRSDVKNNKLDEIIKSVDYLKNDNILIKNAVGVKNKENGERDAQIEAIKDLTTKLEKKTHEKDNNISDNVNALALESAEIKGLLTAYFKQRQEKKDEEKDNKQLEVERKSTEITNKQVSWNDKVTGYGLFIGIIAIFVALLILIAQHQHWI